MSSWEEFVLWLEGLGSIPDSATQLCDLELCIHLRNGYGENETTLQTSCVGVHGISCVTGKDVGEQNSRQFKTQRSHKLILWDFDEGFYVVVL